jgi:hypothetical protein
MAKVPYTKVSKKIASGISRLSSSSFRPSCSHDQESRDDVSEITTILRSAMQDLNRNYRNNPDAADCADGSCDTVYVPVIMHFHHYNNDPTSQYDFYGYPSTGGSRIQKYNRTIQAFNELNKVFAGIDTASFDGYDRLLNAQINDNTTIDYANAAIDTKNYYTKIKDFGYYTGATVYNSETKEYEDEFVSHKELRNLYPNIQFYFPTKIKTEHLIEGMYKESTGLKVNLQVLVDHLDVHPTSGVHALLQQEYFYFAPDYPGAIFWDSSILNKEYVTKLNVLQQIINGNDLDMSLAINPQTGPSYNAYNISSNVEGEDMVTIVNMNGSRNTIFADMALCYDGNEYVDQNTWNTSHTEGWAQSLNIAGPAKTETDMLYHEFGHLMGRVHAWQSPSVAGEGFKEERIYTNNIVSGTTYTGRYKVGLDHDSFGNVSVLPTQFPGKGSLWGLEEPEDVCKEPLLHFDFKPPFFYDIENPKYKRALRDYTLANSEWLHWHDLAEYAAQNDAYFTIPEFTEIYQPGVTSSNVASWVSNHVEIYLHRKNLLFEELNQTPERIVGDFLDISEEEKQYLEFVFDKFVSALTNNFSVKTTFSSGELAAGGSKSSITCNGGTYSEDIPNINNMFEGYDPQHVSRTGMSPITDLAADVLTGASSFWGGSFIIKNPPASGSTWDGEIITQIVDERYVYAVRFESGNYTYAEAVALAESVDGWKLPNEEELSVLGQSIKRYNLDAGLTTNTSPSPPTIFNLAINTTTSEPYNTDLINDNPEMLPKWRIWSTGLSPYDSSGNTYRLVLPVYAYSGMSASGIANSVDNSNSVILIKKLDLLENPNIITQLVVNPTDADGNRKGPNISTHIPFCILPNTNTANATNTSMNTRYDHFWMHNFNAFNPSFPVYPDNTPVDNLLDPEFCPCLHNTQTYYNGDGNTYDFKIIGDSTNAWAAHAMMAEGTRASSDMNEFYRLPGKSKGSYRTIDGNILGSDFLPAYSTGPDVKDSEIFKLANRLTSTWLLYTTNKYKNGYDSPVLKYDVPLYKYSGAFQDVTSLPFFNGYCGFGWATILPKVYDLNPKAYLNSFLNFIENNPTQDIENYYTQEQLDFILNMPDEYNMYPCDYAWQNEIRLASRRAGATTASNNISTRYAIGSADSTSDLYNPLTQYFTQTSANGVYDADHSGTYMPPVFDMSIKKDYYQDLYGEYNPLYLTDVMYYRSLDSVSHLRYWSEHTVKATNYLFNTTSLPHINNMHIIYQEDISNDSQLADVFTGGYLDTEKSDFERYFDYVKWSVLGLDIESEVGGCNDPTMYNYNEFATYNNGTCIEAVSGCMQQWADNYNPNANTEDGSCYGTICTNPDAVGAFGAGYSSSMIDTITEYGAMYNTEAIIEAEDSLVATLNSDNLNVCQFTVVPRNAILKLVCIPRDELAGLTVCNDNPIIKYIADADTGDIYNYTSNPVLMEKPLLEFINTSGRTALGEPYVEDIGVFENGVSKPYLLNADTISFSGQTYYYNGIGPNGYTSHGFRTIRTGQGNSFPSEGANDTLNYYGNYHNTISKVVDKYVIGNEATYINNGNAIKNKTRYNCVENPILADGSGGCFLYSPNGDDNLLLNVKLSACSPAQIETTTYMNCDNEILYSPTEENGGYLTNFAIFQNPDIATLSPCSDSVMPAQKYIIGGSLASNALGEANGQLITFDQLPLYSDSQIHSIAGYPAEVLEDSLIPVVRSSGRQFVNSNVSAPRPPFSTIEESYIVTSAPKQLLFSKYFYTSDGQNYTGPFVASFDYRDESVTFNSTGRSNTSRLYYRNELLRMPNVKLTEEEALAKKMHKVINKIINLPIFTDN